MEAHDRSVLDVRGLAGTRETLAYRGGGLFPVLTVSRDGAVVAVLRGGAGHLGLAGRIEVVRSLDQGATWSPPAVVADFRDPAKFDARVEGASVDAEEAGRLGDSIGAAMGAMGDSIAAAATAKAEKAAAEATRRAEEAKVRVSP